MSITAETTYTAACSAQGCTNTWSGTDLQEATGWVMTFGAWQIGAPQPTSTEVHCPTHAAS